MTGSWFDIGANTDNRLSCCPYCLSPIDVEYDPSTSIYRARCTGKCGTFVVRDELVQRKGSLREALCSINGVSREEI